MNSITKTIVFFLIILLNFNIYSQGQVKELYQYDVNSDLIKKDENLKIWLDNLMKNLFYVGHSFSQSFKHDQSFTKFNLIKKGTRNSEAIKDTILITIPNSPLKVSFETVKKMVRGNITQDIVMEYYIPFYSFNHGAFDPVTFQYKSLDYFRLGLKAYRINDAELMSNILNRMIDNKHDNKVSKFNVMINDINKVKKYDIPFLTEKQQNIQSALYALGKVSQDIPLLMYDVYIYNKKSEDKSWDKMQEFFNLNTDNIKKYLDDSINDNLIIKVDQPEKLLFPANWIKEKRGATPLKDMFKSFNFSRVLFNKNQFEHCLEITFELDNKEQLQWSYGLKKGYNAKTGKTGITKVTLEKPLLITPQLVKIFVHTNTIRGVIVGNEYEEIELFNSKLNFN